MIDTVAGIRSVVSDYVAGSLDIRVLDAAVGRLGADGRLEGSIAELWGSLELLLAEQSDGVLDESELRWELSRLVRTAVTIGPQTAYRLVIGTSASSLNSPATGVRWGLGPSPAADRRVAAALA